MKQHKETWKTKVNDLKEGKCIAFEELLLKLKATEGN